MTETKDFISLDHIIIAVRDLDAAEATYSRILGRSPSWRGTHPGQGTGNILYRLDNTYIEFLAPVGEGPSAKALSARLDETGEGLFGVVLGTANADAAVAALRARGHKAGDPVDGSGRDDLTGAERRWRSFSFDNTQMRGIFMFGIEHLSPADALPKAPLRGEATDENAISAVDHVVVMTPDAEALKTLFGDIFGIRLALDHSKPEWGVRQLFFRLGGVTLEIVQPLDATKAPRKDFLWGLAWRVGSVGAVRERILHEGHDVSEVRLGRKKGTEVATIRKPTNEVPTLLVGPVAVQH